MILSSYFRKEPTDSQVIVSNLNRNCAFYMIILKMHKDCFGASVLLSNRHLFAEPSKIVDQSLWEVAWVVNVSVNSFRSMCFRTPWVGLAFEVSLLRSVLVIKVKSFQQLLELQVVDFHFKQDLLLVNWVLLSHLLFVLNKNKMINGAVFLQH